MFSRVRIQAKTQERYSENNEKRKGACGAVKTAPEKIMKDSKETNAKTESRAEAAYRLVSGKADALLVHNRYNIRYISGYTNDTAVLYISPNRKVLLTDFRYIFQAKEEAAGFEAQDIAGAGYIKAIAALAKLDGVKSIAFEDDELSYRTYTEYEKGIDAKLVPVGNILATLRRIKTEEEIEYLAKAESIGDTAFSEILKVIRPGITELEIAAKLEYIMKTEGADNLSFDSIVASGINSSMCHAMPSAKPVAEGDFLTMDFGCKYKGYCSDMTRTIVVGHADDKQRNIYDTVLKAQLAVLSELKSGVTGKAMDKIARDIIYDAGYEGCFGHGLGHSVGLYIHEDPRCSMTAEDLLEENMIMTVEPGIYVEGFGGVRIEDMVVIGAKSCRNLAFSPKELIEL